MLRMDCKTMCTLYKVHGYAFWNRKFYFAHIGNGQANHGDVSWGFRLVLTLS